jgi:predicted DNA-binding protein (UPF0251 family)
MNTEKHPQQQPQDFLDHIAGYEYFREDGRLVLEPFCVYLSYCFGFDGILERSPQPRNVYTLLLRLINEKIGAVEATRFVQSQRIIDWRPELAYFYPEKTMTCIYPTALLHASYDWIHGIGHLLMGIPEPDVPTKYFGWVSEDWTAVHTFINGYHNAFHALQKRVDQTSIDKAGYSVFEALHLARAKDIEFDEAAQRLITRHRSHQAAMEQIDKAISDRYFLEAITLEECLISNCLFNFLEQSRDKPVGSSFHVLLKSVMHTDQAAGEVPHELFEEIDQWRKARNTAIHGFITARSDGLTASGDAFHQLAEETANLGKVFCRQVVSWYESECVNFVRHEFPSTRKKELN